jgi:rSAM-associated Gly-rich repeat protein
VTFSSRAALLGFLLALSALVAQPAGANATASAPLAPSIEGRMGRIAAAYRERQGLMAPAEGSGEAALLSYGFANRVGGGGFVNGARGGFGNTHPYYGGGGVGFVNGGGGFVNGGGGGGFVNGPARGGVFRNW